MVAYSNTEYTQIGKALNIVKPDVLNEIKPLIARPKPALAHFQLLPQLLIRFSELMDIPANKIVGVHQGSEANELRCLFIAVAITLYSPDLLTLIHTDVMRPNLREELGKVLKYDCTAISQRTNEIRRKLDPYRKLRANEDFKNQVAKISKVLEIEFKE